MRLRFFRPDDDHETAQHLATLHAIDGFWREFEHAARRMQTATHARAETSAWVQHLRAWLGKIDPGLGLELDLDSDGSKRLYVLPIESERLVPLAEAFIERAPTRELWHFTTRRPSLELERSLHVVRRDCGADMSTARGRVGLGRGHAIELTLGSEHFTSSEDAAGLDAAHCLFTRLLGDELFDTWVQSVSILPQARRGPLRVVGQSSSLPLDVTELEPAVAAAVRGVTTSLPELPSHRHCEHADWMMFELPEGEDRVDLPQPDLVMATTMCPEMLKCFLSDGLFSSRRFSGFDETFCYVQLELSEPSFDERVARRVELEEILDRSLAPGGFGCVVGSGMGSRFVYITLALTRLDTALELVLRRLREQQVPRSSWIRFCDSIWRDEWLGVWPETPAPNT